MSVANTGKAVHTFSLIEILYFAFATGVGRVDVGIATRCGLNDPGIDSWWVREFTHLSVSALGPTQPPVRWVTNLLSVVKLQGGGVGHPPLSAAEVKRVQLYLYILSRLSWPVVG